MERICITFLFLLMLAIPALPAGEKKYPVTGIPAGLTQNAGTIIRYENREFEVTTQKEAVERMTIAVTFMNNKSIGDSRLKLPYDKYSRIRHVRAFVYDAGGEIVKRISSDEVIDISAIDGYSLYEDHRVKLIDPEYRTIPFTVEYSWETVYSGILNCPPWSPYKSSGSAVELSRFRVIWPEGSEMRFLQQDCPFTSKDSVAGGKKFRTWEASGLMAYIVEPFSPPEYEIIPVVYLAPNDFEMGGYPGNMETWTNFGKWILSLNQGKDWLCEETRSEVIDMVEGLSDIEAKARKVYDYFQNRTRYVNITEGMGGWQPIAAEEVDRVSYGDCKALSNYLQALLKAAGVNACYTLVAAGDDTPAVRSEFPSNQFNHALISIPGDKDTLWLECTSQHIPFGYLGSFTDDREALIITGSGGTLVRTPVLSARDNFKCSKAIVTFDDGLAANADITIRYGGVFFDEMVPVIHSDQADRKKMVTEMIGIPHFELTDFSLTDHILEHPYVEEMLNLNLDNYCTVMGARVLLPLNLLSRTKEKPVNPLTRKSEIYIRRGTSVTDTVIYRIPAGLLVESLPSGTTISSIFGTFTTEITSTGSEIIYIRTLEMKKGRYPASSAREFAAFHLDIQRFDNSKCVLKR